MIMIDKDQLKEIMPTASNLNIVKYHSYLLETMERFKKKKKKRQCAYLANIAHESGCLRYARELASGAAYDNRKDLGNTEYNAITISNASGTTPGRFYKGRGLIQITGYYNYLELGKYFNQQFIYNPLLLENPKWAALSSGWFWEVNNLNEPAELQKFDTVCDIINKGHKTKPVGDSNGYNDRLWYYERAWATL